MQGAPTNDDLNELEAEVAAALRARDHSRLNILGFGELSIALGWPTTEPRFVCKRTPPFTPGQFADYQQFVADYLVVLRGHDINVADTVVASVERSGDVVGYLVQPLLPSETLGHRILAAATPDSDHPFLVAVGRTFEVVSDRVSIDAQVTNWAWDGTTLTLVDVGTPLMWNEHGDYRLDMTPFLRMIPAALRLLVRRDMTKVVSRWRQPRLVVGDAVANLYRQGLDQWVDPALAAWNRGLDEPVVAGEARALYHEDRKTWPRLKRLQRLERAWRTRVRRRPYDFFIHSSFSNQAY